MKWQGVVMMLLLAVASRAESEIQVDDEYEDVEDVSKAFLLVRRKLSEDRPIADKPVTVTIELYNSGKSPATQIKATEKAWNTEIFQVSGDVNAQFDSISPGTSLSYSYTITPKGKVAIMQDPTIVTYVAEEGGKQIGTSSPWLPFQSFTAKDIAIAKALEAGSKLTVGLLNTPSDWIRTGGIFGGLLVIVMGSGLFKTVSEKRVTSKRKKAMKALGVDLKDE